MKKFFLFCRRPHSFKDSERMSFQKKLTVLLLFLLLDVLLSIFTVYPASILSIKFQIEKEGFAHAIEGVDFFKSGYGWMVMTLLISPIYEEITNRLFLVFGKWNLLVSFIFLLGIFFFSFTYNLEIAVVLFILFFIAFITLGLKFFKEDSYAYKRLKSIWSNHYTYVFYSSVVLFAFFHALDYKSAGILNNAIIILLVIPKAISALYMGYVRVRLGFAWGIILHVLINMVTSLYFIFEILFE